jgi:hypothetical protein
MHTLPTYVLAASLSLAATYSIGHHAAAQETPDCSWFTTYDEAQLYYLDHPEATPYIDPNYDGRACEVWFGVAGEIAADDGQAIAPDGSSSGGESIVSSGSGGLDGVDYDCGDFASQADAQAYFESDGGSATNNVDGLDSNTNGIACEAS